MASELSQIQQDIVSYQGWISGSYVRDVFVRQDPTYVIRDIDVLIPFALHKMLVGVLTRKYKLVKRPIDWDPDEEIAHTELQYGEIVIDIFSSEGYEYLSPPDFDVNTLCWTEQSSANPSKTRCWTGKEFTIWYPGHYGEPSDDEFYGYPFDVNSIIQRAQRKEAVAMTREWIKGDPEMWVRLNKLQSKGWTILNLQNAIKFLSS